MYHAEGYYTLSTGLRNHFKSSVQSGDGLSFTDANLKQEATQHPTYLPMVRV